jgi:hypothetical protein
MPRKSREDHASLCRRADYSAVFENIANSCVFVALVPETVHTNYNSSHHVSFGTLVKFKPLGSRVTPAICQ